MSGDLNTREALEQMLSKRNKNETVCPKYGKRLETGEYVVFCEGKQIRDSRINGAGRMKDVLFVFCDRKRTESLRLIAGICAHEILGQLRDLLYLERLEELGICNDGEGEPVCKYFFGSLQDKEWIVREYVKRALRDNHLPERNMFVQISAMFYEKRTIDTCMYFCEEADKLDDRRVKKLNFSEEFQKTARLDGKNLRYIRKLMELSGAGHGLLIKRHNDSYTIEGVVKDSDSLKKGVFVKFENHLIWKLNKGSETIFEYCNGIYKLPGLESKDNTDAQLNKLDKLNLQPYEIQKMKSAIQSVARKCQHGTSIIFMDEDTLKQELKSLSKYHRTYQVEPLDLEQGVSDFEGILAIDGAILADTNCKCYAVGAIVEAELVKTGTIGRGARYNSLVNYVHALFKKETAKPERIGKVICFAAIISEDETIDVEIPKEDSLYGCD